MSSLVKIKIIPIKLSLIFNNLTVEKRNVLEFEK